jgi:endonuclease III
MGHRIINALLELYPDARCELNFDSPFQLLIATMLSAQTTDKMVNRVTKHLFSRYPTPEAFLKMEQEALEEQIREIGLYRTKAKNILATCHLLVTRFENQVPKDMEALMSLPGVGRKTANVVLSNAFDVDAIAVDTHVFRVSHRLGLAKGKTPEETEQELMEKIPKESWTKSHHTLIWHGRRLCKAQKPLCFGCPISEFCMYFKKTKP